MRDFIDSTGPALQEPHTVGSKQAERIILTYRGWDEYERANGGLRIVDFDLSSMDGSASFHSRREILSALLELHDQLHDVTEEEEFLRARLQGSISYLRVLMGQQISFTDYSKHTIGVDVLPFPDEEVAEARRAACESLALFGITMRVQDRKRFEREFLIHDPDAIKEGIVGNQDVWLCRLREAGIPVPEQLAFSVQFVEVDAYWNNWISGSARDGITLRINVHPKRRYDRGRPLFLCLHEICGHAVQMAIWRSFIVRGKYSPACGLTTVHSPEMLISEGLGQTVADLLSGNWEFPPEFHLSRALKYHRLTILHNAHLQIYQGIPVERILEYCCDNLPLSDPDTLEAEIRDRGNNPLFRCYQLSYSVGERTIRKLICGLSVKQKQRLFLAMYTKPLTAEQLFKIGERVRADER